MIDGIDGRRSPLIHRRTPSNQQHFPVAVHTDHLHNNNMKQTTIRVTRPVTITRWNGWKDTVIRFSTGDIIEGVLYTDHSIQNATGDYHLTKSCYEIV